MKRMALLLLLVCFVVGVVFTGCEKSTEEKVEEAAKSVEKDAEDAAEEGKKDAEKAAEGLGDLAK